MKTVPQQRLRAFAALAVAVAFINCYPLSTFAGTFRQVPERAHAAATQAATPQAVIVPAAWVASPCGSCQSHLTLPGKTETWSFEGQAPHPSVAAAIVPAPAPVGVAGSAPTDPLFVSPLGGPLFQQAVLLRL